MNKHLYTVCAVVLFVICLGSSAFAQRFELPIHIDIPPEAGTWIYTETYVSPSGVAIESQYRTDRVELSKTEMLQTSYYHNGLEWIYWASDYFDADGFVSSREVTDTGELLYNILPAEEWGFPQTIQVGGTYSAYFIDHYYRENESIPFGSSRTDYSETLASIDFIETIFGKIPALRFEGTSTFNREGDSEPTFAIKSDWVYTDWYVPGLGLVKSKGSFPNGRNAVTMELTEISFDFEPQPLPILDSDNAVWNTFGYTWDMGGGWQHSFEFGSLWIDSLPWVWSDAMQSWLYLQGDRKSLWVWAQQTASWLWTNQATYPVIYDTSISEWIRLEQRP